MLTLPNGRIFDGMVMTGTEGCYFDGQGNLLFVRKIRRVIGKKKPSNQAAGAGDGEGGKAGLKIMCWECKGKGILPADGYMVLERYGPSNELQPVAKANYKQCPICNSTGQIDAPLAETCPVCEGDIKRRPCSNCDNRGWIPTPNGQEIRHFMMPFMLNMIKGYVSAALSCPLTKMCPECKGKGFIQNQAGFCTCHDGKAPTEAGREILELVRMFGKE